MGWMNALQGDSVAWLLEHADPGVRYLARRDLLDLGEVNSELQTVRQQAHEQGQISVILDAVEPDGSWVKPGPGYNPKYRASSWAVITLAQLGASAVLDRRIHLACEVLMQHSLTENGQFTMQGTPSSTIDCLQGNLCRALDDLGFRDPRMEKAREWLARSVTGEGVAPKEHRHAPLRYYAYQCGPVFECGANGGLSCAWGGVKAVLALAVIPEAERTPLIRRALQKGVDFLLGVDPVTAAYPTRTGAKPSRNWWKFGFPVFYVTDLLQNVDALLQAGLSGDARLEKALQTIIDKQDGDGRWPMEYSYAGKTWGDYGEKGVVNPYVTLRACRVLKMAAQG